MVNIAGADFLPKVLKQKSGALKICFCCFWC